MKITNRLTEREVNSVSFSAWSAQEVFRGGNEKLILEAMASLFFMGGEDCADQVHMLNPERLITLSDRSASPWSPPSQLRRVIKWMGPQSTECHLHFGRT